MLPFFVINIFISFTEDMYSTNTVENNCFKTELSVPKIKFDELDLERKPFYDFEKEHYDCDSVMTKVYI